MSISSQTEPQSYTEASKFDHWIQAMHVEIATLERNNTWILTELPTNKFAIGC